MVSNLVKIRIFATSLSVIAALGQYPLLAQTFPTNSDSIELETTDDGIEGGENTLPNSIIKQTGGISAAPVASYAGAVSNQHTRLNNASPPRRKIPEPSALIGLMAIASCAAIQQRKTKKI
ncbi:hypothetical protein H6G76_27045 [Nostoc sp. FACHB-152]|uniref:hypothetical protein n=1 Tax=unclassified Nostoc TaxID=2593658 RepID=UPI001688A9B6|nr:MULTISPECIES: hypothetical protein [unclassified Nostoc]MBD2450721.1 hypothetical protein [Nostoc sp. FACHB-152]MBD2471933.1 hypothetical protein [Nostoc sp. FACHB-145]